MLEKNVGKNWKCKLKCLVFHQQSKKFAKSIQLSKTLLLKISWLGMFWNQIMMSGLLFWKASHTKIAIIEKSNTKSWKWGIDQLLYIKSFFIYDLLFSAIVY